MTTHPTAAPAPVLAAPADRRDRRVYAAGVVLVVASGLASRRFAPVLPAALRKSPGDALWALMVFVGCGLLFARRPTAWTAAVAMAFSAAVEFSQRYHAPWIDAVRRRTLGHLILGSGFAWHDLLAYAVGIGIGGAIEAALRRDRSRPAA